MADISKELNDIRNAVYGEEVRTSIVNGISKINSVVEQTIPESYSELVSDVDDLKSDMTVSLLHCDNLAGKDANTYYPTSLVSGTAITVSRSDGGIFDTSSNLYIQFFNANKEQIFSRHLNSGLTYSRMTLDTNEDIAYIRWSETPPVELMVNIGTSKLTYVPYFEEVRYMARSIQEHSDDISELVSDVDDLKSDMTVSLLHCDNLAGKDANTYYPTSLVSGTAITVSRSDGGIFDTSSNLYIQFFNANKEQIFSRHLNSGLTYSRMTLDTNEDVAYIKWSETPPVALMVNIGTSKLAYVPYFEEVRYMARSIQEHSDDNVEVSRINGLSSRFPYDVGNVATWKQGLWYGLASHTMDGTLVNSGITISALIEVDAEKMQIVMDAGTEYQYQYVSYFDGTLKEYSGNHWLSSSRPFNYGTGAYKLYISIRSQNETPITPAGFTGTGVHLLINDAIFNIDEYMVENRNKYLEYDQSDKAYLYSRNIIGMEVGEYYPVNVEVNERVTFSTSDGSVMSTSSNVLIRMLDENKEQLAVLLMNTGLSYRTWTNNTEKTVKYMVWRDANPVPLMVEYGTTRSPYVPYFAELKNRMLYPRSERQIIYINTDTATSVTTVNLEPGYFYAINPTVLQGRTMRVTANINSVWHPVKLLNINTGKLSNFEYQTGEYLLCGIDNATQIKISLDTTTTGNYTVISLVRYSYMPIVQQENRNTRYLPKLTNARTAPIRRCFGALGNYAYGRRGKKIERINLSTLEIDTYFTADYDVASGMVLDNGSILFTVANDTNDMYLLKNGTATKKHSFYNTEYSIGLPPNPSFSYFSEGAVAIVSEYSGSKTPISGYKAYISKNYGETWSTLFNLEDLVADSATRNYHLHSCVYDKYGNMYWACSGDVTSVDMIWYSLDGSNWYPTQTRIGMKPTVIIPMRDNVVFVSDQRATCVYKWQRRPVNAGDSLYFDTIKMFVRLWTDACPIGTAGYHDKKNGICYFTFMCNDEINAGYGESELKYCPVYVTDGYDVQNVYKTSSIATCRGVFGTEDHIVVAQNDDVVILNK